MNNTRIEIDEKLEERKKLCLELQTVDKESEKVKMRWNLSVVAFYTAINMALSYAFIDVINKEVKLLELLAMLLPSVVVAVVAYFINVSIFSIFFSKVDYFNSVIKSKEKQLTAVDKELNELREKYRRLEEITEKKQHRRNE